MALTFKWLKSEKREKNYCLGDVLFIYKYYLKNICSMKAW